MKQISFYPGPSKVYESVPDFVKDAHRKGMLSMNHRSEAFMHLCEQTIDLIRKKLNVPQSYAIYFTSSATECWEIIAQSLVVKESIHLFNGDFGEKWFSYTKKIKPEASCIPFERETLLTASSFPTGDLIAITQNETSNGTAVACSIIKKIKQLNPNHVIAVDATSSMAGIELDFEAADVWFASVQKCFGLPAGLGLLICSPAALTRAEQVKEENHYNSLLLLHAHMKKWQTPFTPNVLAIYLLMRVMKQSQSIQKTHRKTERRISKWYDLLEKFENLKLLIRNPEVRSATVIALQAEPAIIQKVKEKAMRRGFLLGNGYGKLSDQSIRIANFPALKKTEIEKLMNFLKKLNRIRIH